MLKLTGKLFTVKLVDFMDFANGSLAISSCDFMSHLFLIVL